MATIAIREALDVKPPIESVPYQNDLFYGDPGAGKTHLLGTAVQHPELHPMLLVDIDGGATTLRKIRTGIDVVQARNMDKIEEVHKELLLDCSAVGGGYYKSVSLDNVTELQKMDMKAVMNEEYERNPDKTDKLVPSQRAWGKSGERMRMIIRAYRDLPMHFFCTAYVAEKIDERSGTTYYYPSLPGKLRSELPGFFDIVGLLRAIEERKEGNEKEIIRVLQVAKTDRVIAKDRTSSLGDVVRNPTLPDMWEIIKATNVPTTNGKV